MSSFKHLEMAEAVSRHQHVKIHKSFFGLSQTVVYLPTNSPIRASRQDYTPDAGERLAQLLRLSAERMANEIASKGKPLTTGVGHYRLEACLSDDRQFCALQLFRFVDFNYAPVGDVLFFERKEAELAATLLA